ncbi:MAG: YhbY family RNA-binding protein [Clostridia bacterium]|nr:YhbY family RNA-binding protein [Clostridia bacterium]
MITKQQRIKLRSIASTIKPTVWVGKDGFDMQVYEQIKQELFNHELIKITLNPSMDKLDENGLSELAIKTGADVITQIGKKIVLYKLSSKKGLKHVLD